MKIDRQNYKDISGIEALQHGCDVVQLKYDGWWGRVMVNNGLAEVYSQTQRLVHQFQENPELSGVFIGEYLFGTQWSRNPKHAGRLVLFDCWQIGNTPILTANYRDRYGILRANYQLFRNPQVDVIACYPMSVFNDLWKTKVETEEFEGLVYRRSSDAVDATIYREKLEVTEDVYIVDFEPGKPNTRLENTLGALVCSTKTGVIIRVGGGLSDNLRDIIWTDRDRFRGRWLTIAAKKRFESGSLRHPNFKEWREDLV